MLAISLATVASISAARAQSVRGSIVDSASGRAIANARVGIGGTSLQTATDAVGKFVITGAPSGEQVLVIHTPSLDSLSAGYSTTVTVVHGTAEVAVRVPSALQIAATACGERGYGSGGIVLGRLRLPEDSTASLAGGVIAQWKTAAADKSTPARSDERGRFALCGVPLDTVLTVSAATDGASGQVKEVRVSSVARFSRAEVVLRRLTTTTGTFAGFVTDSTNKPISGAEVTLPDLGKGAVANEEGIFVLRDIPAGPQPVLVRHVGYGPVESQLTFVGGQTIQRHIRMTRSTTLDSVVVTAKVVDHAMDDFEANRKLGLGHFLTRADLAGQEARSTGSVLTTLPGVKVYAVGSYAWVGSARHSVTSMSAGGSGSVGLDASDMQKRAPLLNCYALVYVDDHVVFRGQKFPNPRTPIGIQKEQGAYTWEPLFDINSIPVSNIEAIEYYASAAETPVKYAVLNSECGVLVIHTIRYHPTDTTAAVKPLTR